MSFLAPALLFGALGISLPILAHLLSRHKVQRTPWAAMQFLDRSVRVRSRQIRLRDLPFGDFGQQFTVGPVQQKRPQRLRLRAQREQDECGRSPE